MNIELVNMANKTMIAAEAVTIVLIIAACIYTAAKYFDFLSKL